MDIEGNLAEIYMPDCCHPEAKTRIILNVLSCLQSRDVVVYIYNNDTAMVFLLSAYEPDFLKLTVMQRLLLNVDLVWDYITCQPIQSLIVSGSKDAQSYFLFILCQDVITLQAILILIKSGFGIAGCWIRFKHISWVQWLSRFAFERRWYQCYFPVTVLFPCKISIQLKAIHQTSMRININCSNITAEWKYVLYHPSKMHWCTIFINLLMSQVIFGKGYIYQTWHANHCQNGHG